MKTHKISLKLNKKIILTAFYTIIVLSIAVLSSFGESQSKYYDDNKSALVYKSSLYTLTNTDPIKISIRDDLSSFERVYYSFEFVRNVVDKEELEPMYRLQLPRSCKFDNNKSSMTLYGDSIPDSATYVYSCPVSSTSSVMSTNVTIFESFNYEDDFVYQKGSLSHLYSEYIKKHPKHDISEDKKSFTVTASETEIKTGNYQVSYDAFVDWLVAYATEYHYIDGTEPYNTSISDLKNYAATVFNKNNLYKKDNVLPGIKVECDDKKYTCTFTGEDNLMGYARTYMASKTPLFPMLSTVFITIENNSQNKDEINKVFDFYLKEYIYPVKPLTDTSTDEDKKKNEENQKNYELVKNYVDSFGGVSYIIGTNNKIKGLEFVKANNGVIITKSVLTYANLISNSSINLAFDLETVMEQAFKDKIKEFTEDTNNIKLTTKAINSIIDINGEIMGSILKNNNSESSSKVAFNDYYIVNNENNYILVRVFSVGEKYNYIALEEFNYKDLKIEFKNVVNTVTNPDNTSKEEHSLDINISYVTENSTLTDSEIKDLIFDAYTKLNEYLEITDLNKTKDDITADYKLTDTIIKKIVK